MRSALQVFASLLGVAPHQAEDALHSERAAKTVLSRRSFFAASGALAAGSVFVEVAQPVSVTDADAAFARLLHQHMHLYANAFGIVSAAYQIARS